MAAGALRQRVTLLRPVQRGGVVGETLTTWSIVAVVWAQIKDLSGREWYEAQQLPEGDLSTDIIIRYRPDVVRQMRVGHGSRFYDIVAVLDKDSHRKILNLKCRAVT